MILLIDNYDSFSYNLYQMVGELDPDIRVIRNDEMTLEEIRALQPDRIILSPGPGGERRGHRGGGEDRLSGDPDPRCVPRPSGHLPGIRRGHHLRRPTHARKAVRGDRRCGKPDLSGSSGADAGGPVPLSGGRPEMPSGMSPVYRPNGRRGDHGSTAHAVPHLWPAVPSGIHPDAGRENHFEEFH